MIVWIAGKSSATLLAPHFHIVGFRLLPDVIGNATADEIEDVRHRECRLWSEWVRDVSAQPK
jgi:hypothetical protein